MGFFKLETKKKGVSTVESAVGKRGGKKVKTIPIRVLGRTSYKGGCSQCPLDAEEKNLVHPKMEPTGAKRPLIYILGEAPGKNEDEQGEQFIGRSGDLIRDYIPDDLERRVRWSNTVQCRPPGNRTPTETEMACCSQRVEADIESTKPKLIMGFGATPLKWAINESGITDWRGDIIPVQVGSHKCWYAALWHPAYIGRKRNEKKEGAIYFETYKKDLELCWELARERPEPPYIPEGEELDAGMHWELSWDLDNVESFLAHLREVAPKNQCVDIETNMLRPYVEGAKILTISFGTWDLSYAIPIEHSQSKWTPKQLKRLWKIIREHLCSGIRFWAHHLKFETEWLSMPFALGKDILFEVLWHDTMAQAHVLNSSRSLGGLSLDSRCKAEFGIAEKALDDMDRATLDAAPLPKVLRYNARDVKFTDLLRQYQSRSISREKLREAYRIIVRRVPSLTLAQQAGVVPNTEFALHKHLELVKQIDRIEKKIQRLPAVQELVQEQGKPFNSASSPQLTVLLRDKLKRKEGWRVDGGVKKYSTDEKVLSQINHPIAKLILEKRGLEKLDGTYVIGCCPKSRQDAKAGKLIWPDGLIHTIYHYLRTVTGRLSSEDPNLQNFPIRQHREIRAEVEAPKGCTMVSIDYGQIEARVIAMASLCPVLVEALWEHYDIHMDWTKQIGKAHRHAFDRYMKEVDGDEAKAWKTFRSDIKNQWTFPLFFGSPLGAVARALQIDERDLEPQYRKFWRMFAAVKKWQQRVSESYDRKGYVETLTGRRRYAPVSFNEQINTPIQGTAADIVMNGMERLAVKAYEESRWQLAPRMQIHDDLTFYLPFDTLEEDLDDIIPIMVTPQFDFINVPITAEIKTGPNWADMEELATVESTDYGFPKRRRRRV